MVWVVESIHDLVIFRLRFEFIDEALWNFWVHIATGLGWLRLLSSGKSWWHIRFVWANSLSFSIGLPWWRILGRRIDTAFGFDIVLSGLLLLRPFLWWLLILHVNFVVGESLRFGACVPLLIRESVLLLRVHWWILSISCWVHISIFDWRWLSHQKVIFLLNLLCLSRRRFITFFEIKVLGSLFVLTVLRRCRGRYVFLHVNYVCVGRLSFPLSNRFSSANLLASQFHLAKLFLFELQLLSLVHDFLFFVNYSP